MRDSTWFNATCKLYPVTLHVQRNSPILSRYNLNVEISIEGITRKSRGLCSETKKKKTENQENVFFPTVKGNYHYFIIYVVSVASRGTRRVKGNEKPRSTRKPFGFSTRPSSVYNFFSLLFFYEFQLSTPRGVHFARGPILCRRQTREYPHS